MNNHWKCFLSVALNSMFIFMILLGSSCLKSMPAEELKASVELIEVDTKWEKKYYQPWPPKLILVPAISFKIKNIGEKPLTYIYCNAIFKFINETKNLGDSFVAGISGKAVQPGETSETIRMQSFIGCEGKNLAHFKNNPAWNTADVKIFIKSKGSQYILIGEYTISKKINFKEPEPVGMKPSEQEKKDKK